MRAAMPIRDFTMISVASFLLAGGVSQIPPVLQYQCVAGGAKGPLGPLALLRTASVLTTVIPGALCPGSKLEQQTVQALAAGGRRLRCLGTAELFVYLHYIQLSALFVPST